ncbi:MAG: uroporphyrinogen decarboxylase [Blastocatellia bacterium AA13]|nr:MAG: uroporphyrinogen decarboxylase [Blastocatellia bacterium AA13]
MKNDLMIRAARGEAVERTPVWMMRQAGRYLPEYRAVRGQTEFLTLCKTPELAVEVSLQPYRILGVDAVIMFSDILIPVEAMGQVVTLTEKIGPKLPEPIRTRAQVDRLIVPDPIETTPFVMEILRILRRELDGAVPLIGFAGAPWTLAAYMVEGGGSKNYAEIKRMMFAEPKTLHALLDKIADTVILYLNAQIEAGAQIVQLFDSWAGELSPRDYAEFALPYQQKILAALNRDAVPAILFINGCGTFLEQMATSGADVLSIDWRIDLRDARRRIGDRLGIQGNLDPCVLLSTPELIASKARELIEAGGGRRHILNLGHGILPMTPVENARAFIEAGKGLR